MSGTEVERKHRANNCLRECINHVVRSDQGSERSIRPIETVGSAKKPCGSREQLPWLINSDPTLSSKSVLDGLLGCPCAHLGRPTSALRGKSTEV